MSQYYSQKPGYYPPPTPPESNDEESYDDYEVDDNPGRGGDSWLMRCGIFITGGCLTMMVMLACLVFSAALWWLDPCSDCFAASYENSDIGLSFQDPAKPKQEVVNELGMQLGIIEVNRNAASNTIPPQPGVELIIITVELANLSEEPRDYDETLFKLLSPSDETDQLNEFTATPGAIDGGLGFGTLQGKEGTQGRLVFPVVANTTGLVLEWTGGEDSQPRYIEIP